LSGRARREEGEARARARRAPDVAPGLAPDVAPGLAPDVTPDAAPGLALLGRRRIPLDLPVGLFALVLVASLPVGAAAQEAAGREAAGRRASPSPEPRIELDFRGGLSAPRGDLADISDDGLLAVFGVAGRLTDRLGLLAELGFENLERGGRPSLLGGEVGPQVDLFHFTVGPRIELTDPRVSRWHVSLHAAPGVTFVDVEGARPVGPDGTVPVSLRTDDVWEFTGHAAIDAGYDLTRAFTVFGSAGTYALAGEADEPETSLLGKEFLFTLTAGFRIGF